ncbi:MAG TPA: hypothetical protein VK168_05005 [Saprospiraceae bacterium]|nr:hypothetical protein [Saprospiraceae bacterium]
MRQLFDALSSGSIKNDDEALHAIPSLHRSASALATVKSKLKDRLNDALLLVEFNDTEPNSRQKAYLECVKKWAAVNVLLSRNYRELGLQRLEQLLRITRRFEFTDMTIEILYMLRLQTGLIYGREHEYHEYDRMLRQYQDLRAKEDLAETLYANLMIDFVHSKSEKREIAEKALGYFAEVATYLDQYDSFRLHLFGRLLQVAIFDNQNNHAILVELCDKAISFFESKPYKSTSALQVFYYSQLVGHLNLRQYNHCRSVANQYQGMFPAGSYNWYRWQELYFMAEIQAGEYDAALSIWHMATERPEYAELPPSIAEFWRIFEAYLCLLMRCGLLKEQKGGKRFKIGKIWNEIRISSRDKSGMNIPILVVQFLMSLAEGEYGQCIDREESLAKYRTRYLRLDNAARSHYFFRMLELIPRLNFQLPAIKAQAAPLYEKMTSISRESINQNFEVEVIVYETLWDIVLTVLEGSNKSYAKPINRVAVHH